MIYLLIIFTLVLVEAKIKNCIDKKIQLGEEQEILNGKVIIKKQYNKGFALNYLEDKKEMVKTISFVLLGLVLLLFTVVLPKKGNKLFKLGLSLVIGGGISNVYDRVNRGYVIDYFIINFKGLKNIVFNLADAFIFIGSLLLLFRSYFPLKIKSCTNETTE